MLVYLHYGLKIKTTLVLDSQSEMIKEIWEKSAGLHSNPEFIWIQREATQNEITSLYTKEKVSKNRKYLPLNQWMFHWSCRKSIWLCEKNLKMGCLEFHIFSSCWKKQNTPFHKRFILFLKWNYEYLYKKGEWKTLLKVLMGKNIYGENCIHRDKI